MIFYKGFCIFLSDLNDNVSLLEGGDLIQEYKTVAAAKSAITQKWGK